MFLILPIIGSLAAAALKGIFDIGSTIFQNQYNSPQAQLRRLRKAGLPLSYMYQGRVNQQSDSPKLSIDPTLGSAQTISLHQQDQVNQAQIKKIGSEIVSKDIENKIKKGELDWLSSIISPDGTTNQVDLLEINKAKTLSERFIAQHTEDLKQIEYWVQNDLFGKNVQSDTAQETLKKIRQSIINMASQNDLMVQLHGIRGIEETVNNMINDKLETGSDWQIALYSLMVKLFSKL